MKTSSKGPGALDREIVRRAPKVVLHEHLDGSLRPATVLELAAEHGYRELPESDPAKLADWFAAGAARGSLPLYLEGFRHTIAVMQTADALERVAYEYMQDQARDNVVYAEVRFAPVFHTQQGLGHDGVMTAVLRGLQRGARDFDVGFGLIVSAMRNASAQESLGMAELAVAYRDRGCVGFDLAGEEAGHPAKHHLDAFHLVQRKNFSITIHAGESFGPESIWQALQYCGAHRIGHGTRLIEDMVVVDGRVVRLGSLAQYVLDRRIPLELCLSSNVHTAATPSLEEHPFPHFFGCGLRVTLNTDNRLMSRTTMTNELMLAVDTFGCTLDQLEKLTINAMKSAFAHHHERLKFIFDRIKPGYAALRKEA
jgi:adenosine deaminase